MALYLTRKVGEAIHIDDLEVIVTVAKIQGNHVRLRIEAPRSAGIRRGELAPIAVPPAAEAATCETGLPRVELELSPEKESARK